jgi:Excalibur calcium-binding domain
VPLTVSWRIGLIAATGLLALTIVAPSRSLAGDVVDCPELVTQAFAQSYFEDQGGPKSDPNRLDPDGDGLACEENSAPYGGLLKLKYKDRNKDKKDRFKGTFAALFGCHQSRALTLFKRQNGPDRAVKEVTTDAGGRFSIKKRNARGRFYVVAPVRGDCAEDRSLDVFL